MAERMIRLTTLWGWLPTFRAAAEQEHISRAAEQLGVSPSAVSRMIGLIEDDVGQPLFNRVGRSIQLNAAGEHLLRGVRNAMRHVDESLAVIVGSQFVGPIRVASAEPLTRACVLPALRDLRREHPALVPEVQVAREDSAAALLLRGALDVAFVRYGVQRDQLSLKRLGSMATGVYAGAGHPLAAKSGKIKLTEVAQHPFVLFEAERDQRAAWWPTAHRRKVAMTVEALDIAAEICTEGDLLAVLPDIVAERYRRQGSELKKLPVSGIAPTEIFALWREQLDLPGRAEAVVEAVQQRFIGDR